MAGWFAYFVFDITLFGRSRYHSGYRWGGGGELSSEKYFEGRGQIKKVSRGGVDRCNKRITSKKRISNFGNRTARESPECGFYNAKFIFYLCVELVTSLLFFRVPK